MGAMMSGRLRTETAEFAEYDVNAPGVFPEGATRVVRVPVQGPAGYSINDAEYEYTGKRAAMIIWKRRMEAGGQWPKTFFFASG
ncbi:hypothetical protein [Nocardia sp. NPDC058666]|uniref:hypothetical protein n=1 Tax=Nocardia sp. NPDC058666 TaxID=3346587 RepID=UPI0036688FEB